jgi:hypothetical protein
LTTGIIFLEASSISIEAQTIGLKRGSLLGNSKTVELNVLLSEAGVIDVHCPLSVAVVRVCVPLLFGD